jgi:hypothetical protein
MYSLSWAPVAHACNPNNSGGRDQEDHFRGQPRKIVHETLSQKHPSQKKRGTGGVVQGVGSEFKPQYHKKKKRMYSLKMNYFNNLIGS